LKKLILSILCALSITTAQPALAIEKAKKPKVQHICKKNDVAVNILACNIYREARGESDYGMLAVGFVTINRKDHDKFPTSIKKIVYQNGQFSWTAFGSGFKVYEIDQWHKAKSFAETLIKLHKSNKVVYDTLDVTKGATYFTHKRIKPTWAKSMVKTTTIDNHSFYKEK